MQSTCRTLQNFIRAGDRAAHFHGAVPNAAPEANRTQLGCLARRRKEEPDHGWPTSYLGQPHDMWSIGVMLLEMLLRRPPFHVEQPVLKPPRPLIWPLISSILHG